GHRGQPRAQRPHDPRPEPHLDRRRHLCLRRRLLPSAIRPAHRVIMSSILLTTLLLVSADVSLWGESAPSGKRLGSARELAESGKTDEAVAILLSLIESGDNELIPLPDGRSVRTRTLAQAVASTLPAECLAAYRKQLTPRARKWLAEGDLRRVV